MPEPTESGDIDPPEIVKNISWLRRYVSTEGAVIRQAPGSFAFAVIVATVLLCGGMYWLLNREFADREESHKATIESKDATIKELEATVAFQDKKLATFANGAPTLLLSDSAKYVLVNRVLISNDIPLRWNQFYQNRGNAAAIGNMRIGEAVLSPNILTESELDFRFSELMKAFESDKKKNVSSENQPGETMFFTVESRDITKEQYQKYISGNGLLYIFSIVMYRDVNLPAGKWRATENCSFTVKGLGLPPGEGWHVCDQHNQIIVVD